jgi:hypothetical protein
MADIEWAPHTVKFDPDQYKEIKIAAVRGDVTMSEWLRQECAEKLNREGDQRKEQSDGC